MKEQVLSLAKELIRRPSISPEDAGCQDVIGDMLDSSGFAVQSLKFGEVTNLWARSSDRKPLCVFAGHTDVVPTGSKSLWDSDPFQPTIRNGHLYGRGAADMKSSLAAMVIAAQQFCERYPEPEGAIGFLVTSDEEDLAIDGTARVMDKLELDQQSIDFALVGEPSSSEAVGDVIRVGRRGSLNGSLSLTGSLGHVAYADLTPNPIHELIRVFSELVDKEWDEGNEFFTPTTFQISNLASGTGAENVIPAELELKFNFRFNPEQTEESLKSTVTSAVDRIDPEIKKHLQWRLSGQPFLSKQAALTDAVVASVQAVTGKTPIKSTSGGTSDARFLVPRGVETVELGPVNRTIHKINECVALDELEPLARIYHNTLERLLL